MKIYTEFDEAIQLYLEANTTGKTIEAYNDQYRNTETENAKLYPAIYYELLDPISFTQGGNAYQQASAKARIHCVIHDLKESKTKAADFAQEVFLKLHQKQLFNTEEMELTSEWVRVASSIPKRFKNLKVIHIDFEFEIFDYSTLPTNLEVFENFSFSIPQA